MTAAPPLDLVDGTCRSVDPEVMFPQRTDLIGTRAAKQICAACPVLPACTRWTTEICPPHGIWAGLTPDERTTPARPAA